MDKYSKEYLGTRQHIEDMAMVQAAIGFESKPKKMMETKEVESACCGATILWNVTDDEIQFGRCLDCKEWSEVVEQTHN